MEIGTARPGSAGEHQIQDRYGTTSRADRFYQQQVLDRLNDRMQVFVGRQEMIFIATSDGHGECDSSFRAGPPGFVRVLDEQTITWPEYRGNGVMASMGNISENGHVGVLMMDFFKDVIGLHVNGRAAVVEDSDMQTHYPWLMEEAPDGRRPERWVVCSVEEAYVHCSKHIPRMMRVRNRGKANEARRQDRKGPDYFAARATASPWKHGLEKPDEMQEPQEAPPEFLEAREACGVDVFGDLQQPTVRPIDEPMDTRDEFARVRAELGPL